MIKCKGAVQHDFLPHGQTLNKEYYLEAMKIYVKGSKKKKAQFTKREKWMLHHDNAVTHSSLICEYLTRPHVPQPLYMPDLKPADLLLFPKLKFKL
jgi:hypothetical protein